MKRKRAKTLTTAIVAVALGSAALIGPAAAGGSVTLHYVPTKAKDAQALQAGLTLYAIVNAVKNGSIKQLGKNNAAGLAQFGPGHLGVIHQEGNGHNSTLQQSGSYNSYGVFQFGKNTDADVVQHGHGEVGATVTFGW